MKLALFDLDGTLVDSVEDIFVATNALLGRIWNWNSCNQATCVITLWMLQDLIAIAHFNKFTVLHYCNTVSQDIYDS